MHLSPRLCTEYINGVENFLEYAFKHSIDGDMKINYLCIDCSKMYHRTQDEFQYHLLFRGIRRDYTTWYLYGEGDSEEEGDNEVEGDDDDGMLYGDMFDMIKDAYPQVVCGGNQVKMNHKSQMEMQRNFINCWKRLNSLCIQIVKSIQACRSQSSYCT